MTSTSEFARSFDGIMACGLVGAACETEADFRRGAEARDRDGAYPSEDVGLLHRRGLLHAPFPSACGGRGLGIGNPSELLAILRAIGRGSLSVGRLYEGHVNAVSLVRRYGFAANLDLLRRETEAGRPSGVWMAGAALRLERIAPGRFRLHGREIFCSGAADIRRPLVAADLDGRSIMLLPLVADADRADTSCWHPHGMRATASGTVDFNGIVIGDDEIVGEPGDYLRAPVFRGGAWRVLAVQLGGLEAIYRCYRDQLRASPHHDHPIQLQRFGDARIALTTARLWVERSADVAEMSADHADAIDACVDLARTAFEAVALKLIANAQKAIGLAAFQQNNPLERLIRDLSTYLRQPALDASLLSAAAFHLHQHDAAGDIA